MVGLWDTQVDTGFSYSDESAEILQDTRADAHARNCQRTRYDRLPELGNVSNQAASIGMMGWKLNEW